MLTYLVERVIPPTFHVADPDEVARHCRWAVDAYRKVGAVWLGGLVTEDRMFSAVAVEREADLRCYAQSLGIADADMTLRRVVRPIGPSYAQAQS